MRLVALFMITLMASMAFAAPALRPASDAKASSLGYTLNGRFCDKLSDCQPPVSFCGNPNDPFDATQKYIAYCARLGNAPGRCRVNQAQGCSTISSKCEVKGGTAVCVKRDDECTQDSDCVGGKGTCANANSVGTSICIDDSQELRKRCETKPATRCPSGQTCEGGRCGGKTTGLVGGISCQSNRDCPPNMSACTNGFCKPANQCTTNADCPKACFAGNIKAQVQCVRSPSGNNICNGLKEAGQCPTSTRCLSGNCVSDTGGGTAGSTPTFGTPVGAAEPDLCKSTADCSGKGKLSCGAGQSFKVTFCQKNPAKSNRKECVETSSNCPAGLSCSPDRCGPSTKVFVGPDSTIAQVVNRGVTAGLSTITPIIKAQPILNKASAAQQGAGQLVAGAARIAISPIDVAALKVLKTAPRIAANLVPGTTPSAAVIIARNALSPLTFGIVASASTIQAQQAQVAIQSGATIQTAVTSLAASEAIIRLRQKIASFETTFRMAGGLSDPQSIKTMSISPNPKLVTVNQRMKQLATNYFSSSSKELNEIHKVLTQGITSSPTASELSELERLGRKLSSVTKAYKNVQSSFTQAFNFGTEVKPFTLSETVVIGTPVVATVNTPEQLTQLAAKIQDFETKSITWDSTLTAAQVKSMLAFQNRDVILSSMAADLSRYDRLKAFTVGSAEVTRLLVQDSGQAIRFMTTDAHKAELAKLTQRATDAQILAAKIRGSVQFDAPLRCGSKSFKGDVDGNNIVDKLDLGRLVLNYGQGSFLCCADLDGTSGIDRSDFNIAASILSNTASRLQTC
jgi:hypothetical protein